jgi:ribonuclease VapC
VIVLDSSVLVVII